MATVAQRSTPPQDPIPPSSATESGYTLGPIQQGLLGLGLTVVIFVAIAVGLPQHIEFITKIATSVGVVWGLIFAILRFGLTRERFAFVRMAIEARSVSDAGNLVLVAITVHLENKGNTRVSARRKRGGNQYLYDRPPETCEHAGTLKIRMVPKEKKPLHFDWYSLPRVLATTRLVRENHLVVSEADLEQINYLDEFQDPETDYKEVDFWLEPNESYDLTVSVWLRPGIYAAKAFFLGPETKYQEEEYWSCQTVFTSGAQRGSVKEKTSGSISADA